MTVQAPAPRPIDMERMARVMLALLDGDVLRANRALLDAQDEDAVHLLIATFADWLGRAMITPAVAADWHELRTVFEKAIIAAGAQGAADAEEQS